MALYVYVSNGMFVLGADEHLLVEMLPFAKHCRADAPSHKRSVTQMRIASSCRYDPIWKALPGRCHFAPAFCWIIALPLRTCILLQICDTDERSIFLQIRSHLESAAGQMPLRTCDADEHSIFLQIRSHLESAAGQMPLRTCILLIIALSSAR